MVHLAGWAGKADEALGPRRPGPAGRRRPLPLLPVLAWLMVMAVAGSVDHAAAQERGVDMERRVRAAFLYKFTEYVEWPSAVFSSSDMPLTIAVMGDDRLADELAQGVKEHSLSGRGYEIRQLKEDVPAGVHVLFIGERSAAALQTSALQSAPVLVVTAFDDALAQGSVINFVTVEQRVRFDVSLANAERRGLKLSARLLTVARTVNTRAP